MPEPICLTSQPKLLAIGGAHIDRRGRCASAFAPGVSNPGAMREEAGGAAFNSARTAAQLGLTVSILSARGGDMAGETVARAIEAARLTDLSTVHLNRTTPSYTAILDGNGELAAALADMGLYETAFERTTRRQTARLAIEKTDAVLIDANLPASAIDRIVRLCAGKPLYANAISPAKAVRLKPFLPQLACLFMNGNEARALSGLRRSDDIVAIIDRLRAAGLRSGVVTQGSQAAIGFDASGQFQLQPPEIRARDVTGAGDALAGGVIADMMRGANFRDALRHGIAAAALAAASDGAAPIFSGDSFILMLQSVGKPAPLPAPDHPDPSQ